MNQNLVWEAGVIALLVTMVDNEDLSADARETALAAIESAPVDAAMAALVVIAAAHSGVRR